MYNSSSSVNHACTQKYRSKRNCPFVSIVRSFVRARKHRSKCCFCTAVLSCSETYTETRPGTVEPFLNNTRRERTGICWIHRRIDRCYSISIHHKPHSLCPWFNHCRTVRPLKSIAYCLTIVVLSALWSPSHGQLPVTASSANTHQCWALSGTDCFERSRCVVALLSFLRVVAYLPKQTVLTVAFFRLFSQTERGRARGTDRPTEGPRDGQTYWERER